MKKFVRVNFKKISQLLLKIFEKNPLIKNYSKIYLTLKLFINSHPFLIAYIVLFFPKDFYECSTKWRLYSPRTSEKLKAYKRVGKTICRKHRKKSFERDENKRWLSNIYSFCSFSVRLTFHYRQNSFSLSHYTHCWKMLHATLHRCHLCNILLGFIHFTECCTLASRD